MVRLLKIVAFVLLGVWGMLRGAEEALAIWVRRATRPGELDGLSWS